MKWLRTVLSNTKNLSKKTSRKESSKSNKINSKKTNHSLPNPKKASFSNLTPFSTKSTYPNHKFLQHPKLVTNCNKSCRSQAKNGRTWKRNSSPNCTSVSTCFSVTEWNFLSIKTKRNCIIWPLREWKRLRCYTTLYRGLNIQKKVINKSGKLITVWCLIGTCMNRWWDKGWMGKNWLWVWR